MQSFYTLCFVFAAVFRCALSDARPNIVFILVDDLGWGNVGWHRLTEQDPEINTPNLDALVKDGLELNRHYVHFSCTPTRSSFQSGRLPVHVQQNLANPEKPNAGVPRNMTCIGSKMKQAGYSTHIVGKWDVGMATPTHTPRGRGYDTSLIYFEHKNDYFTQIGAQSVCQKYNMVDLWSNGAPANHLNGTQYEEYMFGDHATQVIHNHDGSKPLFLVYTPHVAHCPLQVPKDVYERFNFSNDENECHVQTAYIYPGYTDGSKFRCRSTYHAMVSILDEQVGRVVQALKAKGMYDNTLIVLSSDNGGPLVLEESGANNHPLRGGKYSRFEGGIRVAAFVSGGYLPASRRGKMENGIIHVADWYATFCRMAGVSPFDPVAAASHLPPVDGMNVWPLVSGQNETSPRTELPISKDCLIEGKYKLMLGSEDFALWQGTRYPNASSYPHPQRINLQCGQTGCLFDLVADPTEHVNIASQNPNLVMAMKNRLAVLAKSFFSNDDKGVNSCPANVNMTCACWMGLHHWGGFYGPYQEISI